MTIKTYLISLCMLFGCVKSPSPKQHDDVTENEISQANWLLGTWFCETKKGMSYEVWKQHNDSTYLGTSFVIHDQDTVSSEFIKLVENKDGIHYIPIVPDQNKGMPVSFKLIFMDSATLIFENQKHDFPQTITYQHLSPDSLMAEISGTIKGEYRAQQFPMRKMR